MGEKSTPKNEALQEHRPHRELGVTSMRWFVAGAQLLQNNMPGFTL